MDVVVVGHIIIETIVFPDRQVLTPVLGSPAAYSSVAMARLGERVALCTKVGRDIPTDFVKVFREARIDLAGMRIIGEYSTRNKLTYSTPEKKCVQYMRKAPDIKIEDVTEAADKAGLFYICPMDYEVPHDVVQQLVDQGKEVIVDLGGYGGATSANHPYGMREKLSITATVVQVCSLTKASAEDCQYIFGEETRPNRERYYAGKLLGLGAKRVIVTLGQNGVYYADEKRDEWFAPLSCNVVDTTGAGDAFAAGMIHGYLINRDDVASMIMFGQATACCVVEKTGGVAPQRMPTSEDVRLRIEKEVGNE